MPQKEAPKAHQKTHKGSERLRVMQKLEKTYYVMEEVTMSAVQQLSHN